VPTTFDFPDTVVSVMQSGTQLTYSDDDLADEMSLIGLNRGSLFRFLPASAGTYDIGISGFRDWEFDGTATGLGHAHYGSYAMTVARINPTIAGGDFADTDPTNDAFAGADAITIGAAGAAVAMSEMLANDVDYYALNLLQGQVLSVVTAGMDDLPFSFLVPDTVIALFDSGGTPLVINDDSGDDGSTTLNTDLASHAAARAAGRF
jgi:hypothetical protein